MRYTKEKRVFMVTKYHRFQSSLKVQQAWDKKYPGEKSPTARTILANVKKFKETGSIQDLPHIFTKVNEQRESAKKQLIDLIHEFPKLSVRKAASAVGLNRETVRVFLKEDLHLKPYKEQEYRVQDYLKSKFGNFFIDKTKWPPRSPDLNACDFFLWGYLKERAYKPLPNTIHDLKENIKREIKNIDEKILHSCFKNVSNRCSLILSAEGGHIEDK